jgi:hypothetical protein
MTIALGVLGSGESRGDTLILVADTKGTQGQRVMTRPGRSANPRRPAWEVNRRSSIKDLCVQGIDTRQPNSLIPRGRSSNPSLME